MAGMADVFWYRALGGVPLFDQSTRGISTAGLFTRKMCTGTMAGSVVKNQCMVCCCRRIELSLSFAYDSRTE